MRRRWLLTGAAIAAVAIAAAGALAILGSRAPDPARDIGVELGLIGEPFAIALSGPLWRDRTIRSADGTPDVALITGDEPLAASIAARDRARIGAVELWVDGQRQQQVRPQCPDGRCARQLRLPLAPHLEVAPGQDHHVVVVVRDATTGRSASAALDVHVVRRLPRVIEAERASVLRRAPLPTALRPAAVRQALRELARARRAQPPSALLGAVSVQVRDVGELRDGPTLFGVTLRLELATPRRDVSAMVPTYAPLSSFSAPYLMRSVALRAPVLRDLLVDVDLRRRRIVAIEPGPASVTGRWSFSEGAETRAEDLAEARTALGDSQTGPLQLVRADEGGPSFLGHDGALGLDPALRDWPVSLVFAGQATVNKVKHALAGQGFTHHGHTRWLPYRVPGGGLRFDSDRGVKTGCDASSTDVHVRLYAPSATDHFTDPELGSAVVGTAHLDRNDGCGTGPRMFGFSEEAESAIARVANRLGWRVEPNRLALGNAEPYRRDVRDPGHVWLSNGLATVIWVP